MLSDKFGKKYTFTLKRNIFSILCINPIQAFLGIQSYYGYETWYDCGIW